MSLTILQDNHDKIRKDLEKELIKARNLLDDNIGDVCLHEYLKLCSYCSSHMNGSSDDLEAALEK